MNIQTFAKFKLFAVTYLFTLWDPAARNDDDFVLFVKRHNFRNTVGCTRMIDISGG